MNFSQDNLLIVLVLIIALGGNFGDSIIWILIALLASQNNNRCCQCTNPCGNSCGCGRLF